MLSLVCEDAFYEVFSCDFPLFFLGDGAVGKTCLRMIHSAPFYPFCFDFFITVIVYAEGTFPKEYGMYCAL